MVHFPVVLRRAFPRLLAALLLVAGFAPIARAAATYTWNVNGAASWTTAANWTPARTTPATDDILVFNGATTPTPEPTGITTLTIGQLILTNNVQLKLQSAAPGPYTVTLSGGSGVDLDIPVGCKLTSTYALPTTMTIALNPGVTASIAGRLEWSGQLLPGSAGAVTVTGTVSMFPGPNPMFGTTTLNGIHFQNGSVCEYNGGDPFGATAPSTVTVFESGSTFRVPNSASSLPLSGRTISNLEIVLGNPNVDVTVSGSGTLTVDDIRALVGRLKISLPQVRIHGNTLSHYQNLQFLSGTTVSMEGTSPQLIQGDVEFNPNTELRITNPLGVTMTSDSLQPWVLRIDGGDLTLPSPGPFTIFSVFTRLDLVQGKVHTGSNTLRLGPGATLTGGSANSYVDGKLLVESPTQSSATALFPIGDASRYAPVTIQFPGVGTAPDITVSTSTGDHPNIGTAPLNASRSVNRTWTFPGTFIPSSTVTFGFDPADLDPGVTTSALVVGRYGPPWVLQTPGTRTPTSTQATGVTALNQFQIAEPTYSIDASAGAGGTITPSGVTTVALGGSQGYTITPNTGFIILDVAVDGVSQGPIPSYNFTNVIASHTISATFQPFFTITASAGAGGSIAPPGVTTLYGTGGSQAYTITPDAGFVIQSVVVDGVSQGAIASYTFTGVSANHTISASFLPTYPITASAGTGGTIAPAGVTAVVSGNNQSYTITPNSGFAILDVSVDGVSQGALTTWTFTSVTAAHTIAATFTPLYSITASAGAGGTIAPPGTTTLTSGSNQSYTITPSSGFAVLDVTVDGVSQGPLTTYSFTNLTANHTIAATFTPLYTITASAGANGSITPAGTTTVTSGSNQAYTITANSGYAVLNVTVDGVSKGAITTWTFTNVTANHTIAATFTPLYTIAASSGTGGSIVPAGITVLPAGGSQTYTITPDAGYTILQVQVDGVGQGAITSYPFTNVTANHTISAAFLQMFTITATAGPGGTITPSGVTTRGAGSSQSYTITPAAGKAVADVLVDGVSVGAVTAYSFTNLTANHTIDASFKSVFVVDATAGIGGTITPSGLLILDAGTSPSFTIAANPGYSVKQVVVDGVSQGPITSYSFPNLSTAHTIYASFAATNVIVASAGAGGFTPAPSFQPAGRANAVAFGDLNGDGKQDLLAVNYELNKISVALGNGAGGFGPRSDFSTDTYPVAVTVGDFDGDNRLDAAVTCRNSYTLQLFYGDGSGGLIKGQSLWGGLQAIDAIATDLNGDGRPDFAIAAYLGNQALIYLATGPKTYSLAGPAVGKNPFGIAAGDLNGDGKKDLVTVNYTVGSVSVLLNDGAGGFPTHTDLATGYGSRGLALGDVNHDGKLDLVVAAYTYNGTIRVMLGDGQGGFGPYTEFAVGTGPTAVALADLNADGNLDALVSNYACCGASHSILRGDGTGGFPVRTDLYVNSNDPMTALADINGDGVLDLATPSQANYNVYVMLGTGGSITPPGTLAAISGSNVPYTITPAAGFSIADVKVDGVSQGPLTSYTFNNVTSGHTIAASFTSASAPLMVGGVPNSAEGAATLGLDGNTLVVSGIGNSGDDGVSFGAEDAKTGLGVEFDGGALPIDPTVDTGASLDLAIAGNDGNPLGSVATTVGGHGLDIVADFAPIGATDQTVEVWDDGTRVLSMVVPNGETVHRDLDASSSAQRTNRASAAGDGIGGVEVGVKKKPGGHLLAATQKFAGSRPTTVAGVTVSGNEIRFSALATQPLVLSSSKLRAKSPGGTSHFAQLRISDQPPYPSEAGVEVGGVTGTPLGSAQLAPLGSDWQMTGIGSSGNDGASLDLTVASGTMIEFGAGTGFQIPRDAGAQLVHRVRGTIGSNADADIATVTETAWSDSITLRSDFSPLGATSQTIEILNGSTVVHSGTYGLGQAVYVVPSLTGPGYRAQAASINTSRSNLKDKASLAAPGSSDRPTIEWAWGPGAFDLMIGGTRVTGQVVRFRPNDGNAIKAFTAAEVRQKNPGVPELATLVLRPVGIGTGANGSALRASGGAQVVSTDHDKVRLMSPNGSLGAASAATIVSAFPSPRLTVRPVLIESPIVPDTEAVVFTARGRTANASDVATLSVAAIRNLTGFGIGPVPDSAGAASYLVEIYSGATRVASTSGATPVVQAATVPDRVEHRAAGASFEGQWNTPLPLTVAGGSTVTGDRIRIVRVGSFAPLLSLDALTIEGQGMAAIDFTGVDTASVTGVEPPHGGGLALALPRNPMRAGDDTKFGVTVPSSQHVRLDLYDVSGRRVATLHDGPVAAGTTWIRWEPADRSQHSGVLFARLKAVGGERVQKFTYLR